MVGTCVVLYIVLFGAGLHIALIELIIVLVPLHVPGCFACLLMRGRLWALTNLGGWVCVL
jgi:hypothetical protein